MLHSKLTRTLCCVLTACMVLFCTAASASNSNTTSEEAINAFTAVLNNEAEFFCADGGDYYEPTEGRYTLLQDYLNSFEPPFEISTFVVIDIDNDSVDEVVLEMQPIGFYEVLRYEEGTVTGYIFPYRAMMNLKQDGTFEYSSSATDSGYAKLKFSDTGYEYSETDESDADVATWYEFAPDNIAYCLK